MVAVPQPGERVIIDQLGGKSVNTTLKQHRFIMNALEFQRKLLFSILLK